MKSEFQWYGWAEKAVQMNWDQPPGKVFDMYVNPQAHS